MFLILNAAVISLWIFITVIFIKSYIVHRLRERVKTYVKR